jgi:hypothetical protein
MVGNLLAMVFSVIPVSPSDISREDSASGELLSTLKIVS